MPSREYLRPVLETTREELRSALEFSALGAAAESAYAQMLHDALAPEGIHVAQLIIPLGIGGGHTAHEPAALSETLWRVYSEGKDFRTFVTPLA